eukprot:scaffold10789_cov141-Isochrysis_galbana.AAC.2
MRWRRRAATSGCSGTGQSSRAGERDSTPPLATPCYPPPVHVGQAPDTRSARKQWEQRERTRCTSPRLVDERGLRGWERRRTRRSRGQWSVCQFDCQTAHTQAHRHTTHDYMYSKCCGY